ncbi:IS630 family transposase [Ktedonobacter robiniae]|nr:IS630 family transposase [Ktedonobacter robiniae]
MDSCGHETLIACISGCSGIRTKASWVWLFTDMVALIGFVFDHTQEIEERLRAGPGAQCRENQETLPSRWTLSEIAKVFPFLANYSLAGIWKVLQDAGFCLRAARTQMYSPDPQYQQKLEHLLAVLEQVARAPSRFVALFVDEMGFFRWPDPAPDWGARAPAPPPVADRKRSPQRQWRIIGALDALTGRVTTLDNYIVGRRQVCAFLQQIDRCYPNTEKIYVIMDNWSIHTHAEVQAQFKLLPRLEIVWLPTYAPWLNPIEKLWRKFRQEVLHLHRFADAWDQFRQRCRAFFAQFAQGSQALLRSVGLLGNGKLAIALRSP